MTSALLQAVLDDPEDIQTRLVYADWLQTSSTPFNARSRTGARQGALADRAE